MIYFDNAATTEPYSDVIENFYKNSKEQYFNASAGYLPSFNLFNNLNSFRKQIIKLLNGNESDNIIFTSGATESDNLAVFGSCFNKQKKYLFSIGEHPAVYNCAVNLRERGYKVEFINLQKNGQIDYDDLQNKCDSDTCFVSIMSVNNETGAINDLKKIRNILDQKSPDAVFHVDAVQSFCKIKLDVTNCKINLLSVSAHKIHGLKGVGALYISKGTKLKNINYGGEQEFGLRSGTINYPGISSFMEAIKVSSLNQCENYRKVLELKDYFLNKLKNIGKTVKVVSDENCSPYIISLIFEGNRGETIMRYLESRNILVGTGSACSTNKIGNRVLHSIGYSKSEILGAIRVSFCANNTKNEIDVFVENIKKYFEEVNM